MSRSGERIVVFGAGYVGLVTGACLAELGHQVVLRDVLAARVDKLRRGEVPIYEPGLQEIIARNRERLSFTTDVVEAMDGADIAFVAVGTPPTYSGDADLTAVWTVIDELPQVDRRIVVVMKSTVPVGTGEKVRHRLDERGLEHVGYVSNPEFTAEGTAVRDFLHPDRIVIGGHRRRGRRSCRRAARRDRRARRALRRRVGGDDQARGERSPDDADLVHQRDRQRLRGDGRRRRARGRGRRPRPAYRPELPQSGDRLRGLVLSEGLARAQAAGRQLRLSLPAADGGDRGQRAAEAPADREAAGAPRRAARRDDRAPRTRLQASHRRRARGAEPRAGRTAARRRRGGACLGPRGDARGSEGITQVETVAEAVAGADAAVLVTEWPQLADEDWAALGRDDAAARVRRRAQHARPGCMRAAGFTYEGIGRGAG